MDVHGMSRRIIIYIYGTRARASHTCIHNTMRVITRKDMRQSSTLHHAARENPQVLAAPCYLLLSLQKFFVKKNLHFLHQEKKRSVKSGYFGWRIGCRILLSPGAILHPQHRLDWLLGSSGKSCFSYESQIPTIKSLHSDAFPQVSPRKRWKAEQFHTVSGTES